LVHGTISARIGLIICFKIHYFKAYPTFISGKYFSKKEQLRQPDSMIFPQQADFKGAIFNGI
jgi:hypothetical protein